MTYFRGLKIDGYCHRGAQSMYLVEFRKLQGLEGQVAELVASGSWSSLVKTPPSHLLSEIGGDPRFKSGRAHHL